MAWNKPTPDEMAKEIFGEDAAAVKAKLDKLKNIEETLTRTSETITKQNELIEGLSTSLKNIKISSPYDTRDTKPTPTDQAPQLTDWSDDADKAFAERTAPILATTMGTQASLARREAREDLDSMFHDWALFSDEIDELTKASGLQQKTFKEFWRNAYFIVKGKHHDEIIRDNNKKEGKFYLEPAGSSVVIRGDENAKPEEKLSDAEKQVAKNLGVPLDIYAKNKENMRIQ